MEETGKESRVDIAAIQPWIGDETDAQRLDRIERLIEGAAGADLIILPELWRIGYANFDAYPRRAEPLDGDTVAFLRRAARQTDAYLLGGSLVERDGNHLYNTAVLLDPTGRLVAAYRKTHLLDYPSRERAILEPGNARCIVQTPIATLGIAICYDLRFPDLFRTMAQDGAEVFLVPAAWPQARSEAWEALTRARAVENQATLVACDATGTGLLGRSAVFDPWGVVAASLGNREEVLRTRIDLAALRRYRGEFQAWRER
jgi:predicted amidohydrolase